MAAMPGARKFSSAETCFKLAVVVCVVIKLLCVSSPIVSRRSPVRNLTPTNVWYFSERYFSFCSLTAASDAKGSRLTAPPSSGSTKTSATSAVFYLLLLSGDISVNPGPNAPVLSCYYQNVRSLNNKLQELDLNIGELMGTDIVALTETWLADAVLDVELPLSSHHNTFRRDRGERGGGVLLAVNSSLPAVDDKIWRACVKWSGLK